MFPPSAHSIYAILTRTSSQATLTLGIEPPRGYPESFGFESNCYSVAGLLSIIAFFELCWRHMSDRLEQPSGD